MMIMLANLTHLILRKQLPLFEIRQSDRLRAIKINGRTPCYPPFRRLSSPSDVNSPSYYAINCKIRYELKVPPFVAGERYRAVLLIVWRPSVWERKVQILEESNRRVPSKTEIMVASLKTPEYEETTHSPRNLTKRSLNG